MGVVNYVQIVRQTWQERFDMYMKHTKRELATMLAERDKYSFPEGCKEFEKDDAVGELTSSSSYTYEASTDCGEY